MAIASGMRYIMYASSLFNKTNVLEGSDDFYQSAFITEG